MKILPPLLSLFFLALTASAVPIQVIYTDSTGSGFFDNSPRAATASNPGTTLGQKRRIAFEYALSRWGAQIQGTVPITVEGGWSSTTAADGLITLASATPKHFFRQVNPGTFPKLDTYYPSVLADQLAGEDLVQNGTSIDISVDCNRYLDDVTDDTLEWNYDINYTGTDSVSFVGVVFHEIGHGLGFISALDPVAGNYPKGYPNVWDTFMANGAGTQFTTMDDSSRAALATSGNVFFDGPVTRLYNSGQPAKLYTPTTYRDGSSLHHLDEDTYSTAGSVNELMTPIVSFPTQMFGPLVTSILRDMGYVMADTQAPSISIRSPLPDKIYSSAALAAAGVYGLTTDEAAAGNTNAVGLLRTRVALFNVTTGKWYRWGSSSFDSATFNYDNHTTNAPVDALLPVATGPHTWRAALPPTLVDGSYQLHVTSVDQNDQGSPFLHVNFTIDNTAPSTVIEPWTNGASVFDLGDLAILAPDATTVTCQIRRTVSGTLYYWSGSAWETTVTNLPATQSGGRWRVSAPLPGRNNLLPGQSVEIYTTATDAAFNATTVHLAVFRTAADTSPPEVSVDYPVNGSVLAAPYVYGLSGIARDPETGISSTTLSITRFLTEGGYKFWNGTGWGDTPVDLPVNSDPTHGTWTAPKGWNLPGGATLPNGSYTIQLTARNGESPASVVGATTSFSVDYHPVYTWTGETLRDTIPGNDSYEWGIPQNWSPYGVPGEGDIAVISNNDTVQSTVDRTVYALRLGGDASALAGFSVTVTGSSSKWSDGTIYGTLHVAAGASLTIDTTAVPYLSGGHLVNDGTITFSADPAAEDGGYLAGQNSTILNNGIIQINRNGTTLLNVGTPPVISNNGTIRKISVGGITTLDWTIDNNGTVESDSGTLSLSLGSTETGSSGIFLSADSGARIEFSGGEHVLKNGARFTGPGRGRLSAGSVRLDGAAMVGAAGSPAGGFEETGDASLLHGPGSLSMIGGGGTFAWSDGTISTTVSVGAGANLALDTTATPYLSGGTFNLAGSGSVTGDGTLNGNNSSFNNSGNLAINSMGTVFQNVGTPPVITNTGTFRKMIPGGTTTVNWQLDNNGTVESSSGIFSFNIGSSDVGSSGIFLSTDSSARIEFSGGEHILKGGVRFSGPGRGGIVGGSLRLDGAVSVGTVANPAGGFEESGDASLLYGSGSLSVLGGGAFAWSDGTISTTVTVGAGANLTLDTTATPYLSSATFNLAGTGIVTGDGTLNGNNSTFNNSGNLGINRIGTVFQNVGTPPIITNTGTLRKIISGGTSTVDWKLDNSGTVESDSGTLTFDIGSTETGSTGVFLSTASAARVEFSGGEHVLKNGSRFTGPGRGRLSNGNIRLDGAVTVGVTGSPAGGFEETGEASLMYGPGSLSMIGGGGTFAWSDGTISTTVSVGAGADLALDTTATPYLSSATFSLAGTGTIFGDGTLNGNNSTFNNSGNLAINRTGTVFQNVGTPPIITNTGTLRKTIVGGISTVDWKLDNSGTVESDSGTLAFDTGSTENGSSGIFLAGDSASRLEFTGGEHVLKSGARFTGPGRGRLSAGNVRLDGAVTVGIAGSPAGGFEETGDASLMHGPGSLSFIGGGGTFAWSDGSVSTTVNTAAGSTLAIDISAGPYLNSGTLNNSGVAAVSGSGQAIFGNNSTFNNLAGGNLQILSSGEVFVNVGTPPLLSNSGVIGFGPQPRSFTSTWNFAQTSSGTLDVKIAGTNAATPLFDQMSAPSAALDGKLRITRLGGFQPALGNTFRVLNFSGATGAFATYENLDLGGGLKLLPLQTGNYLELGTVRNGFGGWQVAEFGADASNLAVSGPFANPDGDQGNNALEYAFNLNPKVSQGALGWPTTFFVDPGDGLKHLAITYRRRLDDSDLTYKVRVSDIMTGTWDESGIQLQQMGVPVATGDGITETVTTRLMAPVQSASKKFLEVMVSGF